MVNHFESRNLSNIDSSARIFLLLLGVSLCPRKVAEDGHIPTDLEILSSMRL